MKKNVKGFTLIELVITITIISVLALISFWSYGMLIRRAMVTEGKTLVSAVAKAERIYYAQHSAYFPTGGFVFFNNTLDIDARNGTYFQEYDVRIFPNNVFLVVAHGFGDAARTSVFYDTDPNNTGFPDCPPKIIVLGL